MHLIYCLFMILQAEKRFEIHCDCSSLGQEQDYFRNLFLTLKCSSDLKLLKLTC